ncbi:MAG: tRNA pseudouridine(38-40) synthase TruA [Burkholderiales bacterium]|nr:tRNA pseudouridine(38-40) synthase TruA [Burkholderiales bacterium]
MRIALGVEYDGVGFSGWQRQQDRPTVQQAIETALAAVACEPIAAVCAGRTDAGVHATCQVLHFDTAAARPLHAWVRGANAHLPAGVAVLWAQPVADDFHARFSATARHYRYLLVNRPVRPALNAGRLGWFHLPLDLEAMRAAARLLLGRHDFSAFRSAECQARSPVREVHRIDVDRVGDIIGFSLEANAFLHHMVRNIVGALVYVGKGRHTPGWVAEILASRDRARAAPTFAPDGLYLTGVAYESRWQLPCGERPVPGWPR